MRKSLRLLPLSLCIALALPVQAAEDEEDWSLCPIGDAIPAFDDAPATDAKPAERPNAPTDIEGGTLSRAATGENVIVQDDVRLVRGDQFLNTDALTYNEETGQYSAEGGVRYQDSGLRIVAEKATGNQNSDTHTISDLRYQLVERRGNGGAERIELSGEQGALVGSTYTTCVPGHEQWQLRANRIDINTEEGMAVARNAVLRIGNVPVLYVPWFMFPTDDRRRSGLLYPSISVSGRDGFDWEQPIYWNIAPNYDATITPRIMTDRGAQLGTEFRWLYPEGRGEVYGEWMPTDKLPGREPRDYLFYPNGLPIPGATLPEDDRGLFRLKALHNLDDSWFGGNWHARANLGWVSDTHYLDDFSNSLFGRSSYSLVSTVGLYGRGRYWDAGLMADHQQLTDYTVSESSLAYDRLPRAYLNWSQPFGRWFEAGVSAEAVGFRHDVRNEGSRLDIKPYVSMPLEGDSWFLRPTLAWRYTAYDLDDDLAAVAGDKSPSRSMPIFSVDAGLFFDRSTEIGGERYLHTLEPRIYYLNVPYRDQTGLPSFDTRPMTYSWGQLFRDNRYTGADRQTDANQITTALTTRLISEDDGRERLAASIGQIQYLDDVRTTLGREQPIEKGKSAWIADVSVSPNDRWSIDAGYQWDPKFRGEDLASLRVRYLLDNSGVVNLGYRYRLDPSTRDDLLEQVDFSFLYPVNENWSLVGRYYYSLLDDKLLESIAGVQWESCCLAVRLIARRYIRNRDGDLNDSLRLEFELKGLGSAGQKTERELRRAILGYDRDDLYLVPPSLITDDNVESSPDPIL
ncbi:LPS assembly protein LptD [Marilutibacter spongiae]|uniref:LPS-assembly protein LptD n=1 Tax=Marilutibacter spongiae TaxID=2025720 RepID=A0A7W3TJ11_9GAMM|nr:LPS assembly protein LptD [Lysobacter spongiae]